MGGCLITRQQIALLSEVYNGKPVESNRWWEQNMADDSSFEVGPVKLPKVAAVGLHDAVLKSFPDFQFSVIQPWTAQADGKIVSVLEASGTHSGEPWAFSPEVEPIAATGIKVVNDHERFTVSFNTDGKITKIMIELLPGGRGFSGPPGFYQQIGGKLPPPSASADQQVALLSEVYNGKPVECVDWWDKNFADDSSFEVGPKKLPKVAVVDVHGAILKSFPDIQFNVIQPWTAQADGTVTSVVEAAGTHSGEPYAFSPDVKPIAATGIKCVNDNEKVTVSFNADGKISKFVIEALSGGKGFSGPPGFYQQIGGILPSSP